MLKNKKMHQEELEGVSPPSKYFENYVKWADNRVLFFNGIFNKDISAIVSAWLLYYDSIDSTQDIRIYINSIGGDISAICNIYDIMQMIKSPISTICVGECYSAGALMLAAGSPGKRYIFKNGRVMIHGIQCLFPVPDETGQIDNKNYYSFLDNQNNAILAILAKHTGQSIDQVKQDCSRDLFMDAKAAVEYGIADYIL